ncbi:ENR1 protein, partial [Sapayoa aenigma]|nr:ENR1 protein [Sapayoa aenigma]
NYSRLFLCNNRKSNPYSGLPEIPKFWDHIEYTSKDYWRTPDGIFWICRKRAYPKLPEKWKGSCTLGITQPGFFLLPTQEGDELRVPV